MTILIFIISIAVLILVHEFGHFIVAKKSGIRVDEFGLGFPPKLISKKWGETTYTLNAIPFGGFVRIFGEDPELVEGQDSHDSSRRFSNKPKIIQAAVLVAGVAMNLIFAWLLISLGFVIGQAAPQSYSIVGEVRDAHTTITDVVPKSPAQIAGLQPGDELVSVSAGLQKLTGTSISPETVSTLIAESHTETLAVTYQRSGKEIIAIVTPNTTVVLGKRAIGIGMETIGILKLPIHLALIEGAHTTFLLTKNTIIGLAHFLWDAITFKADFSQVTGVVGIAGVVGQARALGFTYLLSLVALISINLAVINLFPFPALDGGRLLFVIIEAIIRKPLPATAVRWVNTIGFVFLLLLMVVVTGHDILKLI